MRSRRSLFAAPVTASVSLAVLLMLAAPAAQAGTIVIQFDLSQSALTLLSGILEIPSDGSLTGATAEVRVRGTSISNPSAGPARIRSLILTATISGTIGGAVLLTGGFTASRIGGGGGTLNTGLSNLVFGPLALNLNGIINCMGGLCPGLGTFPVSATNSVFIGPATTLGIGGLATLGNATLSGVLPMNLAGNNVVLSLSGQEVSRTFIPEPNTAALLGFGILGMLGIGATRTRLR